MEGLRDTDKGQGPVGGSCSGSICVNVPWRGPLGKTKVLGTACRCLEGEVLYRVVGMERVS